MADIELRCLLSESIPKEGETAEECQDAFGVDEASQLFAISDGVATSFFAGLWARMLAAEFCSLGLLGAATLFDEGHNEWRVWVEGLQHTWAIKTREILSRRNDAEGALLRAQLDDGRIGAATFVGLRAFEDEGQLLWRGMLVGDSCLFFIRGEGAQSILYTQSEEFENPPDCLRSYGGKSDEPKFSDIRPLANGDRILLATDALSRWLIALSERQPNRFRESLRRLFRIQNRISFAHFVQQAREDPSLPLQDDDVAMVTLKVQKKSGTEKKRRNSLEEHRSFKERRFDGPGPKIIDYPSAVRVFSAIALIITCFGVLAGIKMAATSRGAGASFGTAPGGPRRLLVMGARIFQIPDDSALWLLQVRKDFEAPIAGRVQQGDRTWTEVHMTLWLPGAAANSRHDRQLGVGAATDAYEWFQDPASLVGTVGPAIALPIMLEVHYQGTDWYACQLDGYVPDAGRTLDRSSRR